MKISAEGQDREIEEGIIDGQCRRRFRWRLAKWEGKDRKKGLVLEPGMSRCWWMGNGWFGGITWKELKGWSWGERRRAIMGSVELIKK